MVYLRCEFGRLLYFSTWSHLRMNSFSSRHDFGHNEFPPRREIRMSIAIEDLRNFQSCELEQPNLQTNGRQPVFNKTIEWSLVEIVILLTQIRDDIKHVTNRQ